MSKDSLHEIFHKALGAGLAIPAFNIPYLPMLAPVVQAVIDVNSFALIETARLEWLKFEAFGPQAVAKEFYRYQDPGYVRLHLDHVPVIDEAGQSVDYLAIIQEAVDLGYHSVMVDGSHLPLRGNILATSLAVSIARKAGLPCEAELGTIFGHEDEPVLTYDDLFTSGRGFTEVEQARQFVHQTGCDWLSVAVGSIHGAISQRYKDQPKIAARLNLEHLEKLAKATCIPLVLHGGSGIPREYILAAIKKGVCKINIATEIRQAYEAYLQTTHSTSAAQQAVYYRTKGLITDFFGLQNSRSLLFAEEP